MRDRKATPLEQITDNTRPGCVVCAGALEAHELQTCQRCVGRARANLYAIADAYRLLPSLLGQLGSNAPRDRGPKGAERGLPGGAALVMLAGGSGATMRLRAHLAGLDDEWDADDQPGDPTSIAYELGRWEDDWRIQRSEPAAVYLMTVDTAANYLNRNMGWAGSWHPAFDEFADDMRGIRHRLEVVAGTRNLPLRAPVNCFECGERTLVREYGDHGLVEDWTCLTCGQPYDPERYMLAMRAKLEDTYEPNRAVS